MDSDSRSESRKIVRCRALVALPAVPNLVGRTVDIAGSGVCLMLDDKLNHDQKCSVKLEFTITGAPKIFIATAKVVYCICVGVQGFKVGLQFDQIDKDSMDALKQVLR